MTSDTTMAVNCTKQNMQHEAFCQLLKSINSETVEMVTYGASIPRPFTEHSLLRLCERKNTGIVL